MNKKTIIVLSALLFLCTVYSLPLFEFFDSGIPADWVQVQYNGTDGEWTWTGSGSYFFGADANYAEANSEDNSNLVFDAGLFTSSLDCTDLTFVTVDFYRNFQTAYGIGEAGLRTYSGGTEPENFEEELWFQNTSDSFFGVHCTFTFNPINYADPSDVYVEFWYSTEDNTNNKYFKFDVLMIYDSNPGPSTVFFSEYIEGSGNNKALEIYNGSGDAIELDNYRINQSSNGGGWQYLHTFPVGVTLNAGDTWTIVTDEADPVMQAVADETLSYPSVVHFNGNDARGLEFNTTGNTWILLDVIGDPDEDPGTGWDVAGTSEATAEHTLVRKPHTITGNTDWIESASTEERFSEWIVLPQDTFGYLGSFPNHIDDLWPPAALEHNLIGENNVYLDWEMPIPMEDGWLYYHDDSIENGVSNGNEGSGLAVKFQPAAYPCTIEQVRFYCDGEGGQSQDMEIWIIGDNQITVLGGPYPLIATPEAWNTIDIDDIEITSGTFLLNTVAIEAFGPYLGRDDNTYEYGRTLWGNHIDGYTDVGAWGMNYTGIHEAYITYDLSDSIILAPVTNKQETSSSIVVNRDLLEEIIVKETQVNLNLRESRDFLGYNVYRNGELQNTEPIMETEYYDLDLGFNAYEYNITAEYDSGNSDPLEAQCTVDIVDIDPFSLPFLEEWNSNNIYENLWLPDPILNSEWFVSPSYGNPGAMLAYIWSGRTDYSQTIYSTEFDGTASLNIGLQYDIFFDSASEVTLEEMDVEVFDGETWIQIANYNNTNGDFDWITESWNISEYAIGNIFQIRFVAHGEDAYNINSWRFDNIFIGNTFIAPSNLAVASNPANDFALFSWEAPASGNATGYNVYLNSEFQYSIYDPIHVYNGLTNGQTYTAGVSAIYDEGVSEIEEIEFVYLGTGTEENLISPVTKLIGNYPNPFNPTTTISFTIAQTLSFVTLEIYNLKGQKVKTFPVILSGDEGLGGKQSSIVWNGTDDNDHPVSSGIYFYKLKAREFSETKKMILMK